MCILRKPCSSHPAIERLVLRMRMDVDQPGQDEAIFAIDHPLCHAGIIPSDKVDRAFRKRDVDIAAINVTSGGLVPGDDPSGVPDDRRGHCSVLLISLDCNVPKLIRLASTGPPWPSQLPPRGAPASPSWRGVLHLPDTAAPPPRYPMHEKT